MTNAHVKNKMIKKSVTLRNLLKSNTEQISIAPNEQYKQVTIRLWGKGVVLRNTVQGYQISGNSRRVVREGQFIMSKIDARHGAYGIIPAELDNAIVSNDFPSYSVNQSLVIPEFLNWFTKTSDFIDLCRRSSEGSTNRVRLKETLFLNQQVEIPSIELQKKISTYLNVISLICKSIFKNENDKTTEASHLLKSAFSIITKKPNFASLKEVAPIIRRPVEIRIGEEYPELGIRSFGKGTFHKPPLDSFSIGTKRLFQIKSDDLLFSNVFAWEGAIAVAQPDDDGRYGSHRFISCVPKPDIATSDFLCYYFLTPEGLGKIGEASPGGAGRNRTLGLEKLSQIEVPLPSIEKQKWFNSIIAKVKALQKIQRSISDDLNVMMPSILNSVIK